MSEPLDTVDVDHLVEVLKAIAHPVRLQIVLLLCEQKHTVSELQQVIGVRPSGVSQHLAQLRRLGLVSVERSDNGRRYQLKETQLRQLLNCLLRCGRR